MKRKREESEQRDGWRVEVKPVVLRAIVAVNFFLPHSYFPLYGKGKAKSKPAGLLILYYN